MSTPEEIALWTAAIQEIMERDGITEEEANTNLTNLLASHAADPEGTAAFVRELLIDDIMEDYGCTRPEANVILVQREIDAAREDLEPAEDPVPVEDPPVRPPEQPDDGSQVTEEEIWTGAIEELMRTFPGLAEEDANENLHNLLANAAADPAGTAVSVWSTVIKMIMDRDGVDEVTANENFNNLLKNLSEQ